MMPNAIRPPVSIFNKTNDKASVPSSHTSEMSNTTEVPSFVSNLTNNSANIPCLIAVNTQAATITKLLIYSLIALTSLLGNSLLIAVFFRTRTIKKTIDVFVINIAVSDLFIPICLIPRLMVYEITGSRAFLIQGDLGSFLCKISSFLADVSVSVSTHSLVMITAERLLAVLFPFIVRQISSKLRFFAILIVWIISIAIHAPYFYTFRLTKLGQCATNWEPAFNHELTHTRYYTALFVVVVILPFTVITILYSVILWALIFKKDKLSLHRSSKEGKQRKELRKRRVFKMAVAIVIAFALSLAPFNVQQFLILFTPDKIPQCSLLYYVYSEASLILAVAYCTINPCIYFVFGRMNRRLGDRESISLRTKPISNSTALSSWGPQLKINDISSSVINTVCYCARLTDNFHNKV